MLCVKCYRYTFKPAKWFPEILIGPMPWRGKRVWELSAWWLWGGVTLQWWFTEK